MTREVLYRGHRVTKHSGINISRIVCPEHPKVKWWVEIDIRHGWGEVYVDQSDSPQSHETEIVNFKHIEVWLNDESGELSLDRAMGH